MTRSFSFLRIFSLCAITTLCLNAMGQNQTAWETMFDYTISNQQGTATGGTATLGNSSFMEADGYHCKKGIDNGGNIQATLTSATLQTGDKIVVTIYQDCLGGGATISNTTTTSGTTPAVTIPTDEHRSLVDVEYVVTQGDELNGKSSFYVSRLGAVSMYIRRIQVLRPAALATATADGIPLAVNCATHTISGTVPASSSNSVSVTLTTLGSGVTIVHSNTTYTGGATLTFSLGTTAGNTSTDNISVNGTSYTLTLTRGAAGVLPVNTGVTEVLLTSSEVSSKDYLSRSGTKTEDRTYEGTTYTLCHVEKDKNNLVIKETGASAVEVLAFNKKNSSKYTVSVTNTSTNATTQLAEVAAGTGELASSGRLGLGLTGEAEIKIEPSANSGAFPFKFILYAQGGGTELPLAPIPAASGTVIHCVSGGTVTLTAASGLSIKKAVYVGKEITLGSLSTTGNVSTLTVTRANNKTNEAKASINVVVGGNGYADATYAVELSIEKPVLKLVYSDNTTSDDDNENNIARFQWNARTTPTQPSFTQPTLTAYEIYGDGTQTALSSLPTGITYESDIPSVATVATDGTITPVWSGHGTANIYAMFAGNNNYKATDETTEGVYKVDIKRGYTYQVSKGDKFGDTSTPHMNRVWAINDENDKPLVGMVFGGWQWNDYTYTVTGDSKSKTDGWDNASKDLDTAPIDGFEYGFSGIQDAKDESFNEATYHGKLRYGWFHPQTKNAGGNVTDTYPFTLPCRGSYMTFNTTKNGTLTIYILQNGAWNKGDMDGVNPNDFQPHSFYIVNQRGADVLEFSAASHTVSTKQSVNKKFSCDQTAFTGNNYDNTSHNVALWETFHTNFSSAEQTAIANAWNSGIHGTQKIVELDNGSYLAIQKGIVKYTFHATGNETYYFFSNFSKMGFCGANFIPDDTQPTDELTGINGALGETTPYIAAQWDENASQWKIGNTPKGNIAGVPAPQFKTVELGRTFKKNKWNSLCLPFDMTQDEVKRVFGEGTQIIMLNSATHDANDHVRLHFIYHEIQNILTGYPYLIWPTFQFSYNGSLTDYSTGTHSHEHFGGSVTMSDENTCSGFTVANKYLTPNIEQKEIDAGSNLVFKGTPGYCTANVSGNNKTDYSINYLENDIFFSDSGGKVYVSAGSSYGKGYRAYIENKNHNQSGSRLRIASIDYSSYSGRFDGETTAIDPATLTEEAMEALGAPTGVYNVQGQRVSESLGGLAKGVYIVNGKKVIRR